MGMIFIRYGYSVKMTVGELIEELKKYPEDMPIACYGDIPWDRPDFEYINLE